MIHHMYTEPTKNKWVESDDDWLRVAGQLLRAHVQGKTDLKKLGGPESGYYGHKGVPGQVGGSAPRTLRYIPGHVWQRANERATYTSLHQELSKIKELEIFPRSKSVTWHIRLSNGTLVGHDASAQTFLAPQMIVKEGSVEITI